MTAYTRRARFVMHLFAASFLLLTLGALQASADTFTFTSCHVSGGCTGTSFGTVTLTQSGADVLFSVQLAPGENFVETGSVGNEFFLFNDPASGSTVTNVTLTPTSPAGGVQGVILSSPISPDGVGPFNGSIECTVGSQCNGNSGMLGNKVTFTVTNATIAQLSAPNSGGFIFAADAIFQGTGLTGPIDVSTPVPEPASMFLFGTGLVALGAKFRRKNSSNLVAA